MKRRQFIKLSAGAVSLGVVMPSLLLRQARAQSAANRKLVIIQLSGGNDGTNTVIPYTDSNYRRLRPNIGFTENQLQATRLSDRFALHPSMGQLKGLYDQGKVAVILGAGYPNSTLSHFEAMEVWQTGDPSVSSRTGWIGKYADVAYVTQSGLPAASFGGSLPRAFVSSNVVIPNIYNFDLYDFITDFHHYGDHQNQRRVFTDAARRTFPQGSFLQAVNATTLASIEGAERVQNAVRSYNSTVEYPDNNPLAGGLRMAAQILATLPEASIAHVEMGGFDTHADQIEKEGLNRLTGSHATLLEWFSEAVKAFYDDMQAHGLTDVVVLQWSEFGRRPEENGSIGTDHSTSSCMFVVGNRVKGGLYGQQPSLAEADLDDGGNPKHHVDFREVYATILDKWLLADSRAILGAAYPNVGFL